MLKIEKYYLPTVIDYSLLTFVLLELFLMGSGRLLQLNGITFRMFLFSVCMFMSVLYLLTTDRKISVFSVFLLFLFFLILFLATFIASLNGFDRDLILEDIKPLSYFLMLIYFEMVINTEQKIEFIALLIKSSSLILSIVYIVTMYLLYTGQLNFYYFYRVMEEHSDFVFRENAGFFYKGFLYLCIGWFFFLRRKSLCSFISLILIGIAILLTMTKGFIFGLILVILIALSLKSRKFLLLVFTIISLVLVPRITGIYNEVLGDKSESDNVRMVVLNQVIEDVNVKSLLIGHGLGYGVRERPVHMEVSLLEIFHKQGLIGVAFWILILFQIIYFYRRSRFTNKQEIAFPFLLSSLFIYLESLTNPFMNNPIGMSFLLISLVALKHLSKDDQTGLKQNI